jgi:hypothetical protein
MRKNIAIREFLNCGRFNANNLAASGDALVHLNLRAQCKYFIREKRLRNTYYVLKSAHHHGSVCASTDRTAGRSRTIGFHVSPESADA